MRKSFRFLYKQKKVIDNDKFGEKKYMRINNMESIPEKVSNDSDEDEDDIFYEYIKEKNIVLDKIADYEKKIKLLEQTIVNLYEIIEDKNKSIRIARKNASMYQERTCNYYDLCIIS